MKTTPNDIYYEIQQNIDSGAIVTLSTEKLAEYSAALSRAHAFTHFGASAFPQICETVRAIFSARSIEDALSQIQSLTESLDGVGRTVGDASIGLQAKMDKAFDRLVGSLNTASAAAREAAAASERYSKRLVFATWALVAATVVLAIITAVPLMKNLA